MARGRQGRTLLSGLTGLLALSLLLMACGGRGTAPGEAPPLTRTPSPSPTHPVTPTLTPPPSPTPHEPSRVVDPTLQSFLADSGLVIKREGWVAKFRSFDDDSHEIRGMKISGIAEFQYDTPYGPEEMRLVRVEAETEEGTRAFYVPYPEGKTAQERMLLSKISYLQEAGKLKEYPANALIPNHGINLQLRLPTYREIVLDKEVEGTVAGHPDNPAGLRVALPEGTEINIHGYIVRRGLNGKEKVVVASVEWTGDDTLWHLSKGFKDTGKVWHTTILLKPEDVGVDTEDLPDLTYQSDSWIPDAYVGANVDYVKYIIGLEEREFAARRKLKFIGNTDFVTDKYDWDKWVRWERDGTEIIHKPTYGSAIEIAPKASKYAGFYMWVLNFGPENQLLIESFPPAMHSVTFYRNLDHICGWKEEVPTPNPATPTPEPAACRALSRIEKWQIADTIGRYLDQKQKLHGSGFDAEFDRIIINPRDYLSTIRDVVIYLQIQSLKTLFGSPMPIFEIMTDDAFQTNHAFVGTDAWKPEMFDVFSDVKDETTATVSSEALRKFGWRHIPWNSEEKRYEFKPFGSDERVLIHIGDRGVSGFLKEKGIEDGYIAYRKPYPYVGKALKEMIDATPPGTVIVWDSRFFDIRYGWLWHEAVNYLREIWPDKTHALPFRVRYDPKTQVYRYLPEGTSVGGQWAYAGLEATLPFLTDLRERSRWEYPDKLRMAGDLVRGVEFHPGLCGRDECVREIEIDHGDLIELTASKGNVLVSMYSLFDTYYDDIVSSGLATYFPTDPSVPRFLPWQVVYPAP